MIQSICLCSPSIRLDDLNLRPNGLIPLSDGHHRALQRLKGRKQLHERVHHTLRISSYCVIGAGVLVVPTEDEMLDEYTTIYGPAAERRIWSGRGKVQEMDLRRKHAEYLREMLPKFNRLRRGDGM